MLSKKCSFLILIFYLFLSPAIGSAYYFETTLGNGGWKLSQGPISTGGSLEFSHSWWHYEDGWRETEMPPNYLQDEFFLIVLRLHSYRSIIKSMFAFELMNNLR